MKKYDIGYDCLKDKMYDDALDQLEKEGKTLPQIRYGDKEKK